MAKKKNHSPVWWVLFLSLGLLVGGCSRTLPFSDNSDDGGGSTEIEAPDTASHSEYDTLRDTEKGSDSTGDSSSQEKNPVKEVDTSRGTGGNSDPDNDTDTDTPFTKDKDTGTSTRMDTETEPDSESNSNSGTDTGTTSDSDGSDSASDSASDTAPLDVECNDHLPEAIFEEGAKIADLSVVGDTMALALGREGLAIYDISGNGAEMISRVETGGAAVALAVGQGHAYVLHATTGLSVVDIENVDAPVVVGRTAPIQGGLAVSLTGNIAAVLSVKGVALFDVTDPTSPRPLGALDIPDGVAMRAVDNTLYVGDVLGNIRGVSLADPMHPTVDKSVFITGGEVKDLFFKNDLLYALNGDLFHVMDMEEPAATCVASKTDIHGSPYDLHVVDHTAYVLMNDTSSIMPNYNASWAINVVDVAEPDAPTVLGDTYCRKTTMHNKLFGTDSDLYIFTENDVHAVPLAGTSAFPVLSVTSMGQSDCTPVAMTESLLFTFCNSLESHADLTIFNTDGDAPEAIGTLALPDTVDMRVSEDLHHAYVLTRDAGLYVVDISTPAQPIVVSMLELAEDAFMLTVSDGKAAVLMGDKYYSDMFWLLDLSDPAAPEVVLDEPLPSEWYVHSVLLHDDLLYVSERTDQYDYLLTIVDVGDLSAPIHMGSLPITTGLSQLILDDGYLFGLTTYDLFVFDVSSPQQPVEISSLDVPNPVRADRRMGLSNHRLYILGNAVVDVSDPAVPIITTDPFLSSPYSQRALLVSGDRAAVAGDDPHSANVIALTDLSDPYEPEATAEIVTLETAMDLEVLEETAFLLHPTSLEILDVSDPVDPVRLHRLPLPFRAFIMARIDDKLYLAGEEWGLQIVDISNPAAPVLRGRVDIDSLDGYHLGLTADETHVYMADNHSGLLVIDVTDPDAPFVDVFVPEAAEYIRGIEKQGNTLYLASSDGWSTYDVTHPATPSLLYHSTSAGVWFNQMVLVDNFIYLGNSNDGFIYDVSDPASPVLVNTVPMFYDWHGIGPLLRYGDLLVSSQHPIEIFDISDPAAPRLAGHLPFSSAGRMVGAIADGVAYFATSDLVVVDLSLLSQSTGVEPIVSMKVANNVEWLDDKAVVLEENALSLRDVSTPASPRELGRIPIRGDRLDVSDGLAFVSEYFAIHMVDTASSSAPQRLGTLITQGLSTAHVVEKRGNVVYVISANAQLETYDLSDLSNPQLLDTLEIPYIREGVVKDDRMYVTSSSELTVVDISDADSLRMATALELSSAIPSRMTIEGDTLVVASPLMTFDISDPDNPVLRGQQQGYNFNPVFQKDGVAYVMEGTETLSLFDVESQASPTRIGRFRPPNDISDVAFDDNGYAYLVDRTGRFSIWDSSSFVYPPIRSRTLLYSGAVDIEEQGGTLFVLPAYGQIEMGDAATDVQGGFTEFEESERGARDIALDGDLYVLDYAGVVRVLDVADPTALPVAESAFEMADPPTHLLARDNLVVALNRAGDIGVMARTPTDLSVRAEHRLSAYAGMEQLDYQQGISSTVEIWDQKAVVVSVNDNTSDGNLTILDLHAPESPLERCSIDICGAPSSTAMHGSYLFVGMTTPAPAPLVSTGEIHIWDLTEPSQPSLVSVIPIDEATAMDTKGDRLIVSQRRSGISVFDISEPTAPRLLTRIPMPDGATKTVWDEHRVFAITEDSALISVRVDDCTEWQETPSF